MSASAAGARRVVQILGRQHLQPRPLDDRRSAALFDRLLSRFGGDSGCAQQARTRLAAERDQLDDALRRGDFTFAARAAALCKGELIAGSAARASMLDALAKLYDPHSAYLTSSRLTALRRDLHQPAADRPRVRARVVEHGGTRIGVMSVPDFYLRTDRSTSRDARHLLSQLGGEGAEVVLLDLRGNRGGVESEAVALVGALAGPGPVVQLVRADGSKEVLRTREPAAWGGPLVVAVDAMSASVSEVFAAAIQDRARGPIAGQQTHGKGTGQTLVLLSSPRGGREGAVRFSAIEALHGGPPAAAVARVDDGPTAAAISLLRTMTPVEAR